MRGSRQGGDVLTIGTVAGASTKKYPLAPVAQNISYETVSDQPEAQPNQPLSVPLRLHGGVSYYDYDPRVAGYLDSPGTSGPVVTNVPGVVRAGNKTNTVALTGAANPPMNFFEANVNDSGADDGRPRLYVIACEAAEINVYKLSLAHGYTGSANAAVSTDATAKTLTDTRAAWTTNEWVGEIVTCNSETLTATSNTATVITGTGGWSGDPGDGHSYKIGVGNFGTLLSTETWALTPTQPMGRPALWYDGTNTQWRVPTGDSTNDMQSLTAIASGTGNDTWEPTDSGTCDADARHLHVVGEKLYRTTGKNEISILARNTDPTSEANWGDEFYVGSDATNITDIREAGGLSYIAKEDGLYEWDGEGTADNVLPEMGNAPRNGQGMCYWHGGFLVPATNLWWTRTGTPVGPDSNPANLANEPSLGTQALLKHGQWMGLAPYGALIYGLYLGSRGVGGRVLVGRERTSEDPPGNLPIIWYPASYGTCDDDDFHGIHITETSEWALTDIRPVLWFANGNNLAFVWLDKSGERMSQRGDIELHASGTGYVGPITFGIPSVKKQLRVIDGWAEDFAASGHELYFSAALDHEAGYSTVGSAITSDGFFESFWTADDASGDVCNSVIIKFSWSITDNLTDTNGPRVVNPILRAVALPDTTNVWTLLIKAEDDTMRTAKKIRTEMEGYKNDLKKYELPDGSSFNGVLTGIRMLRANEVRELVVDGKQPMPRYTMVATVRELVSA